MVEHTCACGTATRARAPEGVSAPVQFGANVRAMICFLYLGQFLSAARTAQALSELVGRVVSAGTVVSTAGRAAAGLEAFTAKAAQQIAAAPVALFDETSLRVGGVWYWAGQSAEARKAMKGAGR